MNNLNKKAEQRLKDLGDSIKKLEKEIKKPKIRVSTKKKIYVQKIRNYKFNKKNSSVVDNIVSDFYEKFPNHEGIKKNYDTSKKTYRR